MKKVVYLPLILIILCTCLQLKAYAAEKMVNVQLDKDYKNCVFQITWENVNKKADIAVVSPEGNTFGLKSTPDQVTSSDGRILINVGAAHTGTWNVVINGEALGKVEVTGGEIPGNMEIKTFEVTKQNEEYVAKWNVTDCQDNLDIQIYVDTDKNGYDGEWVASLSATPAGNTTFSLNGLSNGSYYFYVKVTDSTGIFNYAYTSTHIEYVDANSPEKLKNISAGMLNSDIYISWDASEHQTFKVLFFDANTRELLNEDTTEDGSYLTTLPKDTDKVLVAAATFDNNNLGKYDMYEVSSANIPKVEVIYPQESITNQKTILADVRFQGKYNITATLNGEVMIEGNTEPGEYCIDMADGDNSIVFFISDNNGNAVTFLKELYVDSTAPQLAIKNDINKMTTNESYIYLQGYSEAATSLYYNDKEVSMVNSYFNIKCNLKYGKNEIAISAKDVAGNEARYTAIVNRSFWNSTIVYGIIIAIVVAVLVIIYTVNFIKGVKRRNANEKN
ncbi:hypothetical protein [Clostridium sp. E02]|uniref:hypothetical protein n=1 Tax=Clostridium sp. E02 TaxID=2487134 RepID=UPI000F54B345|nr:hypothetical protein [Clostridium sp. E02]